jgi:copper chaperone CopZ
MDHTVLWIEGMTCGHCQISVQSALSSLPGVNQVEVGLATKKATLHHAGPIDPDLAIQAIQKEGCQAGLLS